MKKQYEEISVEIEVLSVRDIITSSNDAPFDGEEQPLTRH